MNRVQKRHAPMTGDPQRNHPLFRAIRQIVKPGNIVMEIGAGLGILSFEAAKAHAKWIYAIECDPRSSSVGKKETKNRGLQNKICWLEDFSYNVALLEKVDVLIQETVGSMAFDENFLSALQDAKKRLLKPNGKIIPAKIALWGAPVTGVRQKTGTWKVRAVKPEQFLSEPKEILSVTTKTFSKTKIKINSSWIANKKSKCTGVALWSKITWGPGLVTDASPLAPPTHWKQAHLACAPQSVQPRQRLHFSIQIAPDREDPWVKTIVEWRLKTKSNF